MIETKPHFQSADELPAGVQTAVLHWILAVADSKHRIGMQFSHWVTGTPALEAAVGSAAITQDELGHARSLYSLLRNYPGAPESVGAENDLEAREMYYTPAALMPRWESWLQVIACNLLFDTALEIAIGQAGDSAFQPLAGRIAKMLQEERFHRIFGESWLPRLVQDAQTKQQLQQQLNWAWGMADGWIGPEDDPVTTQLVAAGVLGGNTAVIRQQWLDQVTPLLEKNGLTIPNMITDWSHWNAQFRQNDHA